MSDWEQVANVADALGDVFSIASKKFLELGALSAGGQALDVACGAGGFSRRLHSKVAGKGGRVVGVDMSPAMIEAANSCSAGMEGIEFILGDAAGLEGGDDFFDSAFCAFSLPYFADSAAVLKTCHRTLKPGGHMSVMGIGGPENNEFFTALLDVGGERLQQTLSMGNTVGVAHSLEDAGFIQVATKEIRALVKVTDPAAYWAAVRGLLGLAEQPFPAALSSTVFPGCQLGVSLYFAHGVKRDPSKSEPYTPLNFDKFVGLAKRSIREINPMGVKDEFRKTKAQFVDVRSQESITASIRNSVAIERAELEMKAAEQIPDHDTPIVTYCEQGEQGALAARQLESMGYTNVWNLQGGMEAWEINKMPTV